MRALVFCDSGEVWRNLALPSEITYARVASAGLGLRANYGSQLLLKLDLASVVAGATSRKEGDIKVHANLLYLF
jgi:hemolysin activation/secretion protein